MLASLFTGQLVFDGIVNGLAVGLISLGIVLVYRSSSVVNFAVGNLGLVGAAILALLSINYGVPFWLAALAAVVVGTLAGTVVELVVVRRLFDAAPVTLLVATIGVAQLAVAVVRALPPIEGALRASYPVALDGAWEVGGIRVAGPQLTILLAVPVLAVGLTWLLNRTTLGRAVAAAADNPRLARTVGINPKVVSTAVWAIAGFLSTISMVLISGQSGRVAGLADLGPNTMVRALAAAVLTGMASFRGALWAGVGIGLVQALVRFNLPEQTGMVDMLLFVAVLVAVAVRSRRDDPAQGTFPGMAARAAAVPARLRSVWWARHIDRLALGLLLAAGVALPLVVTQPSSQLVYSTVLAFAVCATSLTVLTGWAGQLSLGQMGFAGLGALLAAALARGLDTELVDLPALTFPTAVAVAALAIAVLAGLIGALALRVRGLLLAVITFAFGLAAAQYLYRRSVLSDGAASSVRFARSDLWGLDLASQRTYYYVVLAVLVLVLAVVARLRATGAGRSTIAVRDNPTGAAAFTVSPFRSKVVAFALSGGLAGLGGALLAGAVGSVPLTERFFQVEDSLALVAIVVIGGLGSTSGPVLGAIWVVGLPALFPDNELVPLFASSLGLLVLLLYLPGGLVDVPHRLRARLLAAAERRLPPAEATASRTTTVGPERAAPAPPSADVVLAATDVVVRFGGNVAVDGASVELHQGEVLGLIGANGAGKSTLLNAIGGFVPARGRIELEGVDVTGLPAPRRARRGLGRTFQAAPLFPTLTVSETILVALEARGRASERAKRADATDLLDLVGLGGYADKTVAELSTGLRRIVELACLLALDARVLCLDEPTAGIAQRETEALGPLLQRVALDLGASMIVIEHDMPFIRSISHRLVCLEAGRVIAEGDPASVCADPRVIASYLGTDDRAIARSGVT